MLGDSRTYRQHRAPQAGTQEGLGHPQAVQPLQGGRRQAVCHQEGPARQRGQAQEDKGNKH